MIFSVESAKEPCGPYTVISAIIADCETKAREMAISLYPSDDHVLRVRHLTENEAVNLICNLARQIIEEKRRHGK
jgi:hypothetical protein